MGRSRAIVSLPLLFLACCISDPSRPSIWPPPDFHLEVRAAVRAGEIDEPRQSFHVWADGLAVYRESSTTLSESGLPVPIYDTVAIYRLHPKTTRALARGLSQKGLFDSVREPGDRVDRVRNVVVEWRQSGRTGAMSSLATNSGQFDRIVRYVNAFLPADVEFTFDGIGGMVEERRTSRVPAPLTDLAGSVECHRRLVALYPDHDDLWVEFFAVALRNGDLEDAKRALAELERLEPTDQPLAPFAAWQRDLIEPLRAALESRDS